MLKTLRQYADENRVTYRTAWNHYREGKIPGATLTDTGRVRLPGPVNVIEPKAAIYARVSSSENKSNLASQAQRLERYCTAKGWQIVSVSQEVGSGVNDKRKKLEKLSQAEDWNILVVEHKDRLTRFGFNYIQSLVEKSGKRIEVVNLAEDDKADLMQDLVAIIYSFSARMYGLRRAKRKTEHLIQALQEQE